MVRGWQLALTVVAATALSSAAMAEGEARTLPDPATVIVPDLSGSNAPDVVANGWKYFFFHRAGTSFAEAHGDISECYRFLSPAGWGNVALPRFVPWVERAPGQRYETNYGSTGLIGLAIGGMIEGTLARRDRQAKMRRCMETRDYVRYGVLEEIWENVAAMEPAASIAIQAKIASGPLWGGQVPVK